MKIIVTTRGTGDFKQLKDMTSDDVFFGFDHMTPRIRVFDAPGLNAGDAAIMRLTDHHVDYVAGVDEFPLL